MSHCIEGGNAFCAQLLLFFVIFRYMIDAADHEKIEPSKNELHNLLDKPQLSGIPVSLSCSPLYLLTLSLSLSLSPLLPSSQVLVLGNKVDLPNALREREIIEKM